MVRSSDVYLEHDSKFGLGFIFNDKRFNVATSRAKSILIVVGNPQLLVMDGSWKKLINYCHVNEGMKGDYFDPEPLIEPLITFL